MAIAEEGTASGMPGKVAVFRVLDDDRAAMGLDRLGAGGAITTVPVRMTATSSSAEGASGSRQQAID